MAVTNASTHSAYTRRDGQAELAWVVQQATQQIESLYILQVANCGQTAAVSDMVTIDSL